ncbi:glycosyltransferase family 2 protein [Mesorhizobium caraganae]|uniref:glycosyltransferase family 2 protein n=1 Tax=Mesorhizobium caraganae TaxID=483206 RepID=UPI002897CC0D|nr:glycosyltransferase family 2 protein [Mesorhizobium caraganae]
MLNEQDAIAPFLRRVIPCLEEAARRIGEGGTYEIVFVDDGSTDATLAALSAERRNNSAVKVVVLSRNFGKDAALAAGMNYALGDAVIPIDVDLQDPPEIIPLLVDNWLEGAKIVNALRADRRADTALKRLTARAFYSAYNQMAERPIPAEVGDFRLIDREVIDVLKLLPERARFMKGLVSWVGFPTQEVPVVREKREAG